MNYKLEKVNESFYSLELSDKKLEKEIKQLLTQEKPPAFGSPFKFNTKVFFFRIHDDKMIIPIGLIPFLAKFGIYRNESEINSEFSKEEILDYIENCGIPFKPYEHQINMIVDSLIIQKQIARSCTGSGKSVVIGLISDFLKSKGLKGLIVVPNISLVQQIFSDFGDYNLLDLQNNCHLIGGSNKIKHLESRVTISTRQSLALMDSKLFKEIDFVIVDECLHPDTLITTQRGQIKIINITLDDTVLTFNETNGAAEYKQIIKIHKNIGKEQMYQVNNTKITGNHKVLTTRGWKRVDELTTADRILTNVE